MYIYTQYLYFLLQAADAKYAKATAKVGPSQMVMFEGNEIMLDIAIEGVVLENGWTITPYTHPGVSLHLAAVVGYDLQMVKSCNTFHRSLRIKLTTLFRVVKYLPASCMWSGLGSRSNLYN